MSETIQLDLIEKNQGSGASGKQSWAVSMFDAILRKLHQVSKSQAEEISQMYGLDGLTRQNEDLTRQIEDLRKQNQELTGQVESLKSQISNLELQNTDSNQKLLNLMQQLSVLQLQNTNFSSKIEDLEAAQLDAQQEDKETLTKPQESTSNDGTHACNGKIALADQIKNLEDIIANNEEELEQYKRENWILKNQLKKNQDVMHHLEAQVQQSDIVSEFQSEEFIVLERENRSFSDIGPNDVQLPSHLD